MGYFWFEGRADDVIKSSGYRVGPFEVESAILHHPAVAEAGVVGKPDPARGEIIAAYVTLKPKQWKGVQIDVGKFVTSAGAEVIESNANWNYSRSLLFAWAIRPKQSGSGRSGHA